MLPLTKCASVDIAKTRQIFCKQVETESKQREQN